MQLPDSWWEQWSAERWSQHPNLKQQLSQPRLHPLQAAPPCNVAPVPVSGVPYYKCGATWYTAGYGSGGVVYMPVPPPPGY